MNIKSKSLNAIVVITILLLSNIKGFSNTPDYEQRRTDYINSSLSEGSTASLMLQAYEGLPLDTVVLNQVLSIIATKTTSDFDIIKLIRILFLTNGEYDAKILPVLYSVPYWINYEDTVRNYWSENHMIMWMSSDWLLHEKYGKPIDATLDARLRHYLKLKNQYGYYEFFSSTYAPFSLSGLLNLADFSQDIEIRDLAKQAAQRLLKDLLLLTNNKGVFFPAAGRNYVSKYENAYGQNHNNLIYLLTGFGDAPVNASDGGAFLASSSLAVDTVISSWKPELDIMYHIGHSLDSGFVINSGMSVLDKTIFQWSSGGYFHPDVVQETAQLLVDSNLWNHTDFELLAPLAALQLAPEDFPETSRLLGALSQSSVICGQDIAIFKHQAVTLSSVQDFWKGKVGFQQYPCVANVGTTAVFTASGKPNIDWELRNSDNANFHFPYIEQKNNVALLMYRPETVPSIVAGRYNRKEVALHWQDAAFDEVVEDSLWLIGRQEGGYVAVRRSCVGEIDGVKACDIPNGQTWVVVVGDSGMYGNFANFQNLVQQSQFQSSWYIDTVNSESIYYAKIVFDTISIDYEWKVDTSLVNSVKEKTKENVSFYVYPNPSENQMNINLSDINAKSLLVKVYNTIGKEVYKEQVTNTSSNNVITINTSSWADGMYFVMVDIGNDRFTQKVLKSK
jgi:hypothetical protein